MSYPDHVSWPMGFLLNTQCILRRANLTQRFANTDHALNNMTTWSEISVPTAPDEDEDDREVMLNREEFQSRLNEFRERVRLEPEDSSITEVMNWYTSINRGLLHHLNEQIKETDSSGVWRSVLAAFSLGTVPHYSPLPLCFFAVIWLASRTC